MNSKNERKDNMKSKNQEKENEVLEMFSTSKLVNDLMRRDGLTPDLMMKKTGMPTQYILAICEGKLDMTSGIALLFEKCLGWSAIELLCYQLRDLMGRTMARLKIAKNYLEFSTKAAEMQESIAQIEKKLCGNQRSKS
jgi:plasmid maintenance system antidote protein VapI